MQRCRTVLKVEKETDSENGLNRSEKGITKCCSGKQVCGEKARG